MLCYEVIYVVSQINYAYADFFYKRLGSTLILEVILVSVKSVYKGHSM